MPLPGPHYRSYPELALHQRCRALATLATAPPSPEPITIRAAAPTARVYPCPGPVPLPLQCPFSRQPCAFRAPTAVISAAVPSAAPTARALTFQCQLLAQPCLCPGPLWSVEPWFSSVQRPYYCLSPCAHCPAPVSFPDYRHGPHSGLVPPEAPSQVQHSRAGGVGPSSSCSL